MTEQKLKLVPPPDPKKSKEKIRRPRNFRLEVRYLLINPQGLVMLDKQTRPPVSGEAIELFVPGFTTNNEAELPYKKLQKKVSDRVGFDLGLPDAGGANEAARLRQGSTIYSVMIVRGSMKKIQSKDFFWLDPKNFPQIETGTPFELSHDHVQYKIGEKAVKFLANYLEYLRKGHRIIGQL